MAKIKGFSHLFGRGAKATEETEDDKDKAKKAKGRRAEEDEQDPDAEENDDDSNDNPDDQDKDPDAEDDSDDADAEEGDENDGDDNTDDRNVKKGRSAERQRCARIFGSKHATGRGDLAISLALNSGMSSAAVIRVLASTTATAPVSASAPRKRSLDERMQAVGNAQPGQDAAAASKGASMVTKMTRLYDSAKGKK